MYFTRTELAHTQRVGLLIYGTVSDPRYTQHKETWGSGKSSQAAVSNCRFYFRHRFWVRVLVIPTYPFRPRVRVRAQVSGSYSCCLPGRTYPLPGSLECFFSLFLCSCNSSSLVRLRVHYISPSSLPILFSEDKRCHTVFYMLLVFVFVLVLLASTFPAFRVVR
jgi:hypothetical protein